MMVTLHFEFAGDQLSNPVRNVRFAGRSCGVVLRNGGAKEALFARVTPGLREAATAAKRSCNKRVFFFFWKSRCRSSRIFSPPISNRSRNTSAVNPALQLAIKLHLDSLGRFPQKRSVFIK